MSKVESIELNGHTLEYLDDIHCYLVDGVILPSITQILKHKFGNKYSNVPDAVLKKASQKGTEVHKAIEDYCLFGKESDLKELRNFKFLEKKYNFCVLANEVPVIVFDDNKPICTGRLDLVLSINNELMLGDIKRTSTLDKEYLAYQLNLYRIGYQQCYGQEIKGLKGIHLREDVRKFVNIPIAEDLVMEYVRGVINEKNNS